jgi:hypothetical protein
MIQQEPSMLPVMKKCSQCGQSWPRTLDFFAPDKPRAVRRAGVFLPFRAAARRRPSRARQPKAKSESVAVATGPDRGS